MWEERSYDIYYWPDHLQRHSLYGFCWRKLYNLNGNKTNDTFPTLSAVNLPAGSPLPGLRYGPVKAEVKSISSHRLHRKLLMTRYRRVESLPQKPHRFGFSPRGDNNKSDSAAACLGSLLDSNVTAFESMSGTIRLSANKLLPCSASGLWVAVR